MMISSPALRSLRRNLCLAGTSDSKVYSLPAYCRVSPLGRLVSATRTLSRASSLRTRLRMDPLSGIWRQFYNIVGRGTARGAEGTNTEDTEVGALRRINAEKGPGDYWL